MAAPPHSWRGTSSRVVGANELPRRRSKASTGSVSGAPLPKVRSCLIDRAGVLAVDLPALVNHRLTKLLPVELN
ncbi:protein of unknown function [Aminobacter niigataensis]|nr:protein of unknown function [Aminobacter niigataensis]